ncbi:NAD(P)H-dependent oxidoreductase [Lentzea sp. HUAS TT2]|uniref:NAD(P)H-dependent oxidoreductase n=1 Tax=Lentzea sp. HUAS TT2 TaxID=3447454 RepID=UPI003F710772
MTRSTRDPVRVLLLGGSLTEPSRSGALLEVAAGAVAAKGGESNQWHLHGTAGDDLADELREAARVADAIVLVTPQYHSSFSGNLKQLLDQLDSGQFAGKPVGLMSTRGGHAVIATEHLRSVAAAMRGLVIPTEVVAHDTDFLRVGDRYELTTQVLCERVLRFVEELLWFAARLRGAGETRAGLGDGSGPPKPWAGQLSPGITAAVAFIRENYAEPDLTLDTASQHAHMSRYHFSRTFKAQTGRRFIDFVTMLRLSGARKLLAETRDPVSGICHAVGYRDLAHFERTFKAWFAMSPSEYRAKYRTEVRVVVPPAALARTTTLKAVGHDNDGADR